MRSERGLLMSQNEGREAEQSKEKEKRSWQDKIILERHGDYFNPRTGTPEFENLEKEGKIGLLTEKGIKETKEAAREKFSEIMKDGKPVDLIFLNSPSGRVDLGTPKGKMQEGYGKRGWDTAQVTMETIMEEAEKSMGLDPSGELTKEQADRLKEKIRIVGIGQSEKLKEADVFHRTYIEGLEQAFGEKFKWLEDYYSGKASEDNIMKLLKKKSGTENIHDVSDRIEDLVGDLAKFASAHREKFGNDRKLVIWAFTHQAPLRAYAEHSLGAPEEDTEGYLPKNNEMIDIDIAPDGKIVARFKDKEYPIKN